MISRVVWFLAIEIWAAARQETFVPYFYPITVLRVDNASQFLCDQSMQVNFYPTTVLGQCISPTLGDGLRAVEGGPRR